MKITKVYLDLKEAKPEQRFGKDVRVLESEAFKDPITLQMEYEPKDLDRVKEVEAQTIKKLEQYQKNIDFQNEYIKTLELSLKQLQDKLILIQKENEQLEEKIKKFGKTENSLKSTIENQQKEIEGINEVIDAIEQRTTENERKLSKQPTVLSDRTFLSGIGESYLTLVKIPDGEYILIQNTKIAEKNEYVANNDDLIIKKIHVTDGVFTPDYTLYGTDAVSTPTATIDRTLAFIPI